jgi:hypothetical protein
VTTDQEATLRAAIRVKLGIGAPDIPALVRGLPQRHMLELGLTQTADFILRRFACGETETEFIERQRPFSIGNE